jgi:hypothetical protein
MRPGAGRRLGVILSSAAVALLLSDCSIVRERICSPGEHVVRSVDSPGQTCVRDGDPPPKGYEEFPAGKVPTYVDEVN